MIQVENESHTPRGSADFGWRIACSMVRFLVKMAGAVSI
jgi:hypothetical protein